MPATIAVSILSAAALAGVYLGWQPPSADLAAQTFRADLFAEHGFVVWSNDWYSGFHVPGYSLLFPPLGAALGPRVVGALAVVVAAGLFALIASRQFGQRAWLGSLWFGVGIGATLFTGRLTFVLGVAIGLGSLLALQRGRRGWAGALAALTTVASPVAGLFLALAGAAVALTGDRRGGASIVLPAIGVIGLTALVFPIEGQEPFVPSVLVLVIVGLGLMLALVPQAERQLRAGTWLYAALLVALFVVPNPLGGNATRLGALFAGPVLALAMAGRRPAALAVAAVPLVYWQLVAPVVDLQDAVGDPSVEASFYAPMVAELERAAGDEPVRVHSLPTRNRWESVYVAERFPLARGWLRQSESEDFDLFQDDELTPASYHRWLDQRAVSFVAVPDAELDYLAQDEAELIGRGLPYLREIWSNENWQLYAVRRPFPLAGSSGAELTRMGEDWFELRVTSLGPHPVRVGWTPYWRVVAGQACVTAAPGDWTLVDADSLGTVRVEAKFSASGLFGDGESCPG